jgi:glycosyltransferase involved in cell wall biosynthesis
MKLIAIVPAYDAAATVAPVIAATRRIVPEVLVIDDGSRDRTAEVAHRAGARVVRLAAHRGKGAALRAGFAEAIAMESSAAITLDADGQHEPSEIPRLIACWQETGASLVIGSRVHLETEMTRTRRFGNRFARRALTYFSGVEVPDAQSGFRLYDAALLRTLRLRGSGYELESEVIVRAARAGMRVASTPVCLAQVDGLATSHYRPWRDTARICTAVVATWFGA